MPPPIKPHLSPLLMGVPVPPFSAVTCNCGGLFSKSIVCTVKQYGAAWLKEKRMNDFFKLNSILLVTMRYAQRQKLKFITCIRLG